MKFSADLSFSSSWASLQTCKYEMTCSNWTLCLRKGSITSPRTRRPPTSQKNRSDSTNEEQAHHSPSHREPQPPREPREPREPRTREDKLKFDSEFDFEQANQRFEEEMEKEFSEKLKITDTHRELAQIEQREKEQREREAELREKDSGDEPKTFYDKNLSFFDSISCEATDKQTGKPKNWKEERKLNSETFGSNGYNKQNYRSNYNRPQQQRYTSSAARNYYSNYSGYSTAVYNAGYNNGYSGRSQGQQQQRPQSGYYEQQTRSQRGAPLDTGYGGNSRGSRRYGSR